MANWRQTLDISDEWMQHFDGKITLQQLAGTIAPKVRRLETFGDELLAGERDEIAGEFQELSEDAEGADDYWFDGIMNHLYDWGDAALDNKWNGGKLCWIKTGGKVSA